MPSGVPVTILPLTGHVTLGNLCKLSSLGFLICKMEELILCRLVAKIKSDNVFKVPNKFFFAIF